MASLTDVSAIARKGIKIGAGVLIVLMIIPVVSRAVIKWWREANPAPPPPPTVRYGKLPELKFPESNVESNIQYKLETISGSLPTNLPSTSRVYIVGINRSRLVSLDRIRGIAKTLGFTTDLAELDSQNYKFVHQTLPADLRFNIITWQFAYRLDWTTDPEIYTPKSLNPQGNAAIAEARQYFQKIGLLSADLASGTAKHQYLLATNSAIIKTDSFFDSNFTRVDLFRADKDELKVLTPGGDTSSPVNIILSGSKEQGGLQTTGKRVLQANYYYSQTVDNDFATYPLRGIQQAYNELVEGRGYVARKAGENVVVRKAYLAYYESDEPQNFLQPIYVFEGDGNFMAYVQAVDVTYINIPQPTPSTPSQ